MEAQHLRPVGSPSLKYEGGRYWDEYLVSLQPLVIATTEISEVPSHYVAVTPIQEQEGKLMFALHVREREPAQLSEVYPPA